MKQSTLKGALLLAAAVGLSACGGGGGGTAGGSVDTPPPANAVSGGPASASSADLLDFVVDGGHAVYNEYSNKFGMTRLYKTETVNGVRHEVTVDRLPNGDYGLIQYSKGSNKTVYKLDDKLAASTDVPDGHYNGAFEVTYSVDGGKTWNVGSGDASATLETKSGWVHIGGMAASRSADSSDFNSVEYFSSAKLKGGKFSDSAAKVVYRENGSLVSDHRGTIDGKVVGSGEQSGIVALVGGSKAKGKFRASGGFTLSRNE